MDKMLIVDHEKCTGCRLCELVCSVFHTGASNPSRSRIRVIKWENVGFYLPMTCQNCETNKSLLQGPGKRESSD
jgi:Fe-S-cluster-containing hydrogenase component 2